MRKTQKQEKHKRRTEQWTARLCTLPLFPATIVCARVRAVVRVCVLLGHARLCVCTRTGAHACASLSACAKIRKPICACVQIQVRFFACARACARRPVFVRACETNTVALACGQHGTALCFSSQTPPNELCVGVNIRNPRPPYGSLIKSPLVARRCGRLAHHAVINEGRLVQLQQDDVL